MKAMIVSADPNRVRTLESPLRMNDFDVEIAPTAMHAASILERSQPDVIVSECELSDMTGCDLHEIVRGDPSLVTTGFILLAAEKPAEFEMRKHDLVMNPNSNPNDIALIAKRLVQEVLNQVHSEVRASQERAPSIGGSLDDADLLNLVQWLAKSNSTGKLLIHMDGAYGGIYFSQGRPTHAEYNGRIGEEAVIRLFGQASHAVQGHFSFEKLEPDALDLQTRTIRKSLFQLLMELANFESVTR
jgi:CheY-like chemotaxis protein